MALITSRAAKTTLSGTEEIPINDGGADGKITVNAIDAFVGSAHDASIASLEADVDNLEVTRVLKTGDTMTGDLVLNGNPTTALGASTKGYVDAATALLSPKNSPTFTGIPLAPTAVTGTSTTQIATTSFVQTEINAANYSSTDVTAASVILLESQSGYINVNRAGAVDITLPIIGNLTSSVRTFYRIKDTGFNANATTQIITINRGGSDVIENAATSVTITTAGEDVYLYNDGNQWFITNVDTAASTTAVGVVELATDAESKAFTDTTRALTSSNISSVLDDRVFKTTALGSATKTMTGGTDYGLWYVTYTSTGTCAITLPDPTALSDATKEVYEIVDAGAATTNNITITSGGSATIDGATSFTISTTGAGAKFFTDGTNWFSTGNTAGIADDFSTFTADRMIYSNASGVASTTGNLTYDGAEMVMLDTENGTSSAYQTLHVNPTSTSGTQSAAYFALVGQIELTTTAASTSNVAGVYGLVTHSSSGTHTTLFGTYGRTDTTGSTPGTVTNAVGTGGDILHNTTGASTITNAISLYGGTIQNTGSGTITNAYGLFVEDVTGAATNSYGVYIEGGATYALWCDADAARFDGRVYQAKGSDIASAGTITLGADGNFFDITGTTTINEITGTGWTAGSIVTLQFDASVTVTNNSGGTNDIMLSGGSNLSATANDILMLVFDGTDWHEISRTVK